jgi:hypothetical protein
MKPMAVLPLRDESLAAAPQSEVRILLVHGTWARGFFRQAPYHPDMPRWFEKGSTFSTTLQRLIEGMGLKPVLEEPLLWTGANALLHRAEAAQRVAQKLKKLPPVPCLVVAHSHGGNIVLRALEELDDSVTARIRVITLATPFVELFLPHPGARNFERLQLAMFLFLVAFGTLTSRWLSPDISYWSIASVVVPAAAFMLWVLRAEEKEMHAIGSLKSCLAVRLKHGAGYSSFKQRAPRTLILRGVEDEASLLIALAAALGRLLQYARDITHRMWHAKWLAAKAAGAVLALSVLSFGGYAWMYGGEALMGSPLPMILNSIGLWSAVAVVGIPLALSGLTIVARVVCGIAAGRELFWLPNLEVSVSTAPDLVSYASPREEAVKVVTVPRRGRVLEHIRHSLYDDPDVFVPIATWLQDALRTEVLDARETRGTGRAFATTAAPKGDEPLQ